MTWDRNKTHERRTVVQAFVVTDTAGGRVECCCGPAALTAVRAAGAGARLTAIGEQSFGVCCHAEAFR